MLWAASAGAEGHRDEKPRQRAEGRRRERPRWKAPELRKPGESMKEARETFETAGGKTKRAGGALARPLGK